MTRVVKAPDVRRAELIAKSKDLFFKKGYSDTTVRDIIKSVNGSQGMFYHYFNSKEDIYQTVVFEYVDEYIRNLNELFGDVKKSLHTRIIDVIDRVQEVHNNLNSVLNWSQTPENMLFIGEIRRKIVIGFADPVESLILELIEKGIMKPSSIVNGKIYEMASFLAQGISGLLNLKTNNRKVKKDSEIFEELIRYSARVLEVSPDYFLGNNSGGNT